MYLELVSRIPVVAAQTHIGTARLQEAQDESGLSNEGLAREIHISEKTWRRWKKTGAIPTTSLPAAARALRLTLHELDPAAEAAVSSRLEEQLAEVLELVKEQKAQLLALQVAVADLSQDG